MNSTVLSIIRPTNSVKVGLYGLLLAGVYHSALNWLVTKDWAREAYSYGYLIPFVVLYLIWTKRNDLSSLPSVPSWRGMVILLPGIMLFWLGELGGEYLTLYVSFWLILVGLCWLHLGWQKLKTIAFALIFMLTMFPLPNFLYTKLTLKLRLIASHLGVVMIQYFGLPAYREGNIIDLGFTQLQVAEACSGLHSLISLIVLSLLLAYFFKAQFWKRAVLLISAAPLAIFTNSLRITATALLYRAWGQEVAEGFFHGFSGLLIFILSLPVLLMEMWLLTKLPPSLSASLSRRPNPNPESFRNNPERKDLELLGRKKIFQPLFIVSLFLLATMLVLSHGIDFREKIPPKKPLDRFPMEVNGWSGDRKSIDQIILETLDLSEYVMVDYSNRRGQWVNFYVAYYKSQRKGESIHSPATCLPGTGWDFKQVGAVTLPLLTVDGESMRVNSAVMERARDTQIAYYWFAQRGRILTNAYQLKIFAFWDAITKQRTDGALVRLITPVYRSETVEEAEARLQMFISDIIPVLEEFIPGEDLEIDETT